MNRVLAFKEYLRERYGVFIANDIIESLVDWNAALIIDSENNKLDICIEGEDEPIGVLDMSEWIEGKVMKVW